MPAIFWSGVRPSATKGDLIVAGDTASLPTSWTSLAAGSDGLVLTAKGAAQLPAYQTPHQYLNWTDTGTVNNKAWGTSADLVIEFFGASNATLTGMVPSFTAQTVGIRNTGTTLLTLLDNSGSSSAGNRLFLKPLTTIRIAPNGWVSFFYDGSVWVMSDWAQGNWISAGYSGGDFTASAGTWTVEAGDYDYSKYMVVGSQLFYNARLITTSLSLSALTLSINQNQFGGYTPQASIIQPIVATDNSTNTMGFSMWSSTTIDLKRLDGALWAASTNNSSFYVAANVEIA